MIRKITAIYTILIGVSMISMWSMFYLQGAIPELETEPARIIMHIVAEFVTAIVLIIGGYGLLKFKKWGYDMYLLGTGALIYTLIQSPGYYIHLGERSFVLMFGVFILIALILLIIALPRREAYTRKNYYF